MQPVNIYNVSRVKDEELFNIVEKHAADDHDAKRIRVHEIESLRILADALTAAGMTIRDADGFYFGFTIPQIGKELDLLKVTGKYCLNIELKSQEVSESQILNQLLKNRHYLTHLGKRLMLFTAVTDTMTCYRLSLNDNLVRVGIEEIADAVAKCSGVYDGDIEKSFKPSEYLISPAKTPDKFIQGKYFLTPAQDQVKSEVMKGIDSSPDGSVFHITGRPGTGKTLLMYDLARSLAEKGPALMMHFGTITDTEKVISREIENLEIISAEDVNAQTDISLYDFLIIDEAHRLRNSTFDLICGSIEKNEQICIFSSASENTLTEAEKSRNISGRIRSLQPAGEYVLSERLRMNMELYTFIMKLKHLTYKTERKYTYSDVVINYANSVDEATRIISYFKEKGYVFINAHHGCGHDSFEELEENYDRRYVIGQEYDKVVMLMDNRFYYDEDWFLKGIPEPDPEDLYPNLFYQGITRVREKLALVVMEAPELFRSILSIIQ